MNKETHTNKKAGAKPYGRWIIMDFLSRDKKVDIVQLLLSLGFTHSDEIIPVIEDARYGYRYYVGILTLTGYKRGFLNKEIPLEMSKRGFTPVLEKLRSWNGVKKKLRKVARCKRLTPINLVQAPQSPVPAPELMSTSLNTTVLNDVPTASIGIDPTGPAYLEKDMLAIKSEMVALKADMMVLKTEMVLIVKELAAKILASREILALDEKYKGVLPR